MVTQTENKEALETVRRYKRLVASRYRGVRGDELERIPPGKGWVSPKIDGEFWCACVQDGELSLIAPSGRELKRGAPLLDELKKTLAARSANCIVAGELFAAGGKGRPRVGDVGSALSASGDPKRLGFQAFDIVEMNDEFPPEDYAERLELLTSWLDGGKRSKLVKTEEIATTAVQDYYDEYVASGKAEGLVMRFGDGRIYKIKPSFHLDCAVIGFTTKQESPDVIRSVLLGLLREDGTMHVVGSCGNLGTTEARKAFYEQLAPKVVDSGFRRASSSGAIFRLVQPELVFEIITTDIQLEDSSGAPVRQWAIRLDEEKGWVPVAPVDGAGLIHPILGRVRDDKSVNADDVRVAQLSERSATGFDAPLEDTALPESTIVRREAYGKVSKGALAVRKLLVWKTNKDGPDSTWPAFVVHFTDYSPGRKDPLKREVRTAMSEDAAMTIAEGMLKKNIKKGWELRE